MKIILLVTGDEINFINLFKNQVVSAESTNPIFKVFNNLVADIL